jgi:hypothetical protein
MDDNNYEVDLYNLKAIQLLERAGITMPSEEQISTVEKVLKSA